MMSAIPVPLMPESPKLMQSNASTVPLNIVREDSKDDIGKKLDLKGVLETVGSSDNPDLPPLRDSSDFKSARLKRKHSESIRQKSVMSSY